METLLWLQAVEGFALNIPAATPVLYLQENQAWELCLLSAWQRNNGGRTCGVIHTTVRPWDLRFLICERLQSVGALVPRPDVTLVNGPVGRESLLLAARGALERHEVEALRFLMEMNPLPIVGGAAKRVGRDDEAPPRRDNPPRTSCSGADRGSVLLVLGEYDPNYSADIVRMAAGVAELARMRSSPMDVIWRPHPATGSVVIPSDWTIGTGCPMDDLLAQATSVLGGATSTSIVHAISRGLPVAVLLARDAFNSLGSEVLSHVRIVRTAEEVYRAAHTGSVGGVNLLDRLFHRDPDLRRWRAFLDEHVN